MSEITFGTKKTLNGYTAWFTIENQTFELHEVKTKAKANWHKKMLHTAFYKFAKSITNECGVHLRDDLTPSFLKSIDSIKNNIK